MCLLQNLYAAWRLEGAIPDREEPLPLRSHGVRGNLIVVVSQKTPENVPVHTSRASQHENQDHTLRDERAQWKSAHNPNPSIERHVAGDGAHGLHHAES